MSKTESPRTRKTKATPPASPVASFPDDVRMGLKAALDRKATNVVVLDLRGAQAFTDFFVVCTGQTARQVNAIADAVEAALKKTGVRPEHIEGTAKADWVLMDYFDFIVHVFTPDCREFYALERLWGSAVRVEVSDADVA
jgi:ribosome-associated protein